MSVSSHGDSVSETSGSHDTSVVNVRDNSGGGVSVEGLSIPLAVDGIGMISGISDNTVVDNTVVRVRGVSVSVEGLGLSLPLAVDHGVGISDNTVMDNGGDGMHSGVGEPGNLGQTVSVVNMGDGTSVSLAGQDLSDGVRLRLSLSLPLSIDHGGISDHRVVDSSVREASYSSNTGIVDSSDNTTSSAASQHLSDGVGIRLAADGYSQEHCEEGTHGEC